MSVKSSSLLCLALLLACSSAIDAVDITKTLGTYPEFSTFTKYITETKLVEQINSRNTITVLAVENPAMESIASKPSEVIKAIVSTHVILDYFDEKKLAEAQASSQQLTTLFQASGQAVKNQGFLKVSVIGEGGVGFGSAADGAPADGAELMRTVTTEPYNISILQVTKPIIAPGVESLTSGSSGSAAPTTAQDATAPASSENATAPSPADETVAESPKEAVADAPATSPIALDEDAADNEPAEAPKNSASTMKMGLVGAVMTFASSLFIAL